MNFEQINEAAQNPILKLRVMIGMLRVGVMIARDEDPKTEGYNQRVQFAHQSFYNMDDLARRMAFLVVADQGKEILTDEEIEKTVRANWNLASGVIRKASQEAAV